MKTQISTILIGLLGASGTLFAQNTSTQLDENTRLETRLLSTPSTEKWQPPVKKEKVWSNKVILDRQVRRQGGRHVILEECATELVPEKVEEPYKVSTQQPSEPSIYPENYRPTLMVSVSAAVYKEGERAFTKLRIQCGGDRCEGWSTIDFNHFRGVLNYIVNGQEYYQIGGYGDVTGTTAIEAECPVNTPELNTKDHGFVVISEGGADATNKAYVAMLDMHELYAVEKDALAQHYKVRLENRKLWRAWNDANPQQPEDITIRFWKRQIQGSQNK